MKNRNKVYVRFIKSSLDRVFAILLFFATLPVMIILSTILFFEGNGGIFFKQDRNGYKERAFTLYKFRTMSCRKANSGELLTDKERLTRIGRIIRKTSLDELPQLFNIIKGDMSFIGPRPLLIKYLPYFRLEEKIRFSVKPGITGLAQVSGRNTLSWDKRLSYDVEYVKNVSFALDFKILVMTIIAVFSSQNIVVDPESIMKNLDDERRFSF
ncbi:MAG: sugar transferase [Candidatus Delongbacteria bacterium]|nr:sugar transferase [Candidatus Delongbacteria bacterium]